MFKSFKFAFTLLLALFALSVPKPAHATSYCYEYIQGDTLENNGADWTVYTLGTPTTMYAYFQTDTHAYSYTHDFFVTLGAGEPSTNGVAVRKDVNPYNLNGNVAAFTIGREGPGYCNHFTPAPSPGAHDCSVDLWVKPYTATTTQYTVYDPNTYATLSSKTVSYAANVNWQHENIGTILAPITGCPAQVSLQVVVTGNAGTQKFYFDNPRTVWYQP